MQPEKGEKGVWPSVAEMDFSKLAKSCMRDWKELQ